MKTVGPLDRHTAVVEIGRGVVGRATTAGYAVAGRAGFDRIGSGRPAGISGRAAARIGFRGAVAMTGWTAAGRAWTRGPVAAPTPGATAGPPVGGFAVGRREIAAGDATRGRRPG